MLLHYLLQFHNTKIKMVMIIILVLHSLSMLLILHSKKSFKTVAFGIDALSKFATKLTLFA